MTGVFHLPQLDLAAKTGLKVRHFEFFLVLLKVSYWYGMKTFGGFIPSYKCVHQLSGQENKKSIFFALLLVHLILFFLNSPQNFVLIQSTPST